MNKCWLIIPEYKVWPQLWLTLLFSLQWRKLIFLLLGKIIIGGFLKYWKRTSPSCILSGEINNNGILKSLGTVLKFKCPGVSLKSLLVTFTCVLCLIILANTVLGSLAWKGVLVSPLQHIHKNLSSGTLLPTWRCLKLL